MTQQDLVDEIKAFCLAHYEEGYDACIECWDYAEYVVWIADFKVTTVDEFVKSYQFVIDHRNEMKATAF